MTASASLPASMQSRAFSRMSVWLGESFVIRGLVVTLRQAATTRADISGWLPNCTPPSLTFGQEMFTSMASIGESSKRRVTSTYSSIVDPLTLAKKRVSLKSRVGRIWPTTWSAPGFCSPMALIMPMGVSITRCGGLPRRAVPVVPLRTIAPTSAFEKPSIRVYSSPKPTHPESRTIGEFRRRPQKSTEREGSIGRIMAQDVPGTQLSPNRGRRVPGTACYARCGATSPATRATLSSLSPAMLTRLSRPM